MFLNNIADYKFVCTTIIIHGAKIMTEISKISNSQNQVLKAGTKYTEVKNDKETESIFKALDKNKDGVLSNDEVQLVQGKTKDKNGNFQTRDYYKIGSLDNGRSLVVNAKGEQFVMSHDGIILKKEYVAEQTNKQTNKRNNFSENE
jgi:hypothetical protein